MSKYFTNTLQDSVGTLGRKPVHFDPRKNCWETLD